jgi:hypothetical protein
MFTSHECPRSQKYAKWKNRRIRTPRLKVYVVATGRSCTSNFLTPIAPSIHIHTNIHPSKRIKLLYKCLTAPNLPSTIPLHHNLQYHLQHNTKANMRQYSYHYNRPVTPPASSPQDPPSRPPGPPPHPQQPLFPPSFLAGTVLLLSALLISTSVRNVCSQISAFIFTLVWKALAGFVAYVNAGVFFTVVWVSMAMGETVHHAVLDWGKGKGGCGNKFMECRPWDSCLTC